MSHTIRKLEFWPVDVPLTDPFVVATGSRTVAENVFLRVTLSSGTQGYGETAPFPEVGGETRESSLIALQRLGKAILGHSAARYTNIGHVLSEQALNYPAARCGLETAVIDAYCHALNIPMWKLWGSADVRARETDITIPIADLEKTVTLARGWYAKGFRLFKMKVGNDVENDIRRLKAVHHALPGISFIGDGNQGFSRQDCLAFVQGVKRFGGTMVLLEQPVVRDDLDSMAAIRRETGIPVAADESVRSLADAHEVVARGAADCINIKIMKTGVIEAGEIASFTKAAGLKLMVGGMLETHCYGLLFQPGPGTRRLRCARPRHPAATGQRSRLRRLPIRRPPPAPLVGTRPRYAKHTSFTHHHDRAARYSKRPTSDP